MKCTLPFGNIKIFARGVHALAKIGNELLFECSNEGVRLKTINMNRSAFAELCLWPDFFTEFVVGQVDKEGDASPASEKFKLSMKSAVWVFRSVAVLERIVERVVIETLVDNEDYIKIVMQCKFGVNKTYLVPMLDYDSLKVSFDPSATTSTFLVSSRAAFDALQTFLSNQEEVTMNTTKDKFVMKNFVDSHDSSKLSVHSSLSMWPDEFVKYDISAETELTFCLMEMRAIVAFANAFALNLKADFTVSGEPLMLTVELEQMLEARVILSTMSSEDGGSQLTSQPLSQTMDTLQLEQSVRHDEEADTQLMEQNEDKQAEADPQDSSTLSPPSKRVRYFFERCFNSTLNPMANVDRILAPDSDPEDDA